MTKTTTIYGLTKAYVKKNIYTIRYSISFPRDNNQSIK